MKLFIFMLVLISLTAILAASIANSAIGAYDRAMTPVADVR